MLGIAASFSRRKLRAAAQVGVKATRWAPSALPVRARRDLSSSIVRRGLREDGMRGDCNRVNGVREMGEGGARRLAAAASRRLVRCYLLRESSVGTRKRREDAAAKRSTGAVQLMAR